jgi:hypothetical protein
MTDRPKKLLSQNSELRKAGVFNWTLPAFVVTRENGERFNVCPQAGACARVCYARFGTYRFSNVQARHLANLEYVLGDLSGWREQMRQELKAKKFRPSGNAHTLDHDETDKWIAWWVAAGGKAVRIHDAGDFFSADYLEAWRHIARTTTDVLFYAYTKEVALIKERAPYPLNMRFIFSYGGRQDILIDDEIDRHADVFPTLEALDQSGYYNQEENDLLAVVAPTHKIGIVANNIPTARKRFQGKAMRYIIQRADDTLSA